MTEGTWIVIFALLGFLWLLCEETGPRPKN